MTIITLRRVVTDPLLSLCLGWAVGATANLSPKYVLSIVVVVSAVRILVLVSLDLRRTRARRARSERMVALREPDRDAMLLAAKHGHKEPIVGKAIEIWAHPSLDSMLPIWDLGIEPRQLTILDPVAKNFEHALARCGGLKSFPPPNDRKYGIARLPLGVTDDEDFRLSIYETDWNTYRTVRNVIEANADLRRELSHIVPEQSLVPQSMSLHFVVRFRDGEVLALRRKEGIAYEASTWSVSAEEQFREGDVRADVGTAEHWFRRSFIEEVFGHRTSDSVFLNRIWVDDCSPKIRSYRLWSFFLEENSAIFQPCGVFQLNITPQELRTVHEAAVSAGWGTTDPEGEWYYINETGVSELLSAGDCEAYRLHGEADRRIIHAAQLHTTSRYRLWRLHRALHRSAETMTQLGLG
jgi:hypothetical protein